MKIKFCGIRRLEDVAYCNDLQPDYLGMILSEGFRRTVPIETAAKLAAARCGRTALVGVFVDETPEHIAQVLKQVPLDVIQLHGSETAEIVSGVRWRTGLPIWKAVRVQNPEEIRCGTAAGCRPSDLRGTRSRTGRRHRRNSRLESDRWRKTPASPFCWQAD